MRETFVPTRVIEHGGRCDCELLAQAMRIDPSAISFEYCRNVLQKRWRMTCRHGHPESTPAAAWASEHWRDIGQLDPVKAILISNDATEE